MHVRFSLDSVNSCLWCLHYLRMSKNGTLSYYGLTYYLVEINNY